MFRNCTQIYFRIIMRCLFLVYRITVFLERNLWLFLSVLFVNKSRFCLLINLALKRGMYYFLVSRKAMDGVCKDVM